ncbi:hypothetical protein J2S09_004736 [Bacillus fengqiuensis]|nr:hypothetical protein [Bacillus fengqiuensis]
MFKRLFPIIISLIMLLSIYPSVEAAGSFKDVTMYSEEIEFLASKEIIKGYEGGYFKPKENIKRIQAVQMILRELGYDADQYELPDPGFIDLTPGQYGYNEVTLAVQLGFISGKTNSSGEKYFDVYGPLTRGQMAKIIALVHDLKGIKGMDSKDFTDVPKNSWEYDFVSAIAAYDITTGYEDNSFRPNHIMSRQHFAVFLARCINDSFKPNLEQTFTFVKESELSDEVKQLVLQWDIEREKQRSDWKEPKGIYHLGDDLYIISAGSQPTLGYKVAIVKTVTSGEQMKVYVRVMKPLGAASPGAASDYPYVIGKSNVPSHITLTFIDVETGETIPLYPVKDVYTSN